MNYIEVQFLISPYDEASKDVLSALLADIGFESFVDATDGLTAYAPSALFDAESLREVVSLFPIDDVDISYQVAEIEGKNWNEEWEKNYFQPLVIDERCIVQSSFHHAPKNYEYNITIDPKMAFGTGHHQTTELMMRFLLEEELSGVRLLDMGCGTAILAILASMRGADPILAIDIDQWAFDNAEENLRLNNIRNVQVLIGGAELLKNKQFGVVLANINRNILLQDIARYAETMSAGGRLFMSGFYAQDILSIEAECTRHALRLESHKQKNDWVAVKFVKC